MHTLHFVYLKNVTNYDGNSSPTHGKRKLGKTYKNVFPQKQVFGAEVRGDTYS